MSKLTIPKNYSSALNLHDTQLATEDMFITEHYFIMTSPYGNAIVDVYKRQP